MNPIGVRKADQLETVSKRMKPEQEEPEESGVKLNDLPELPFERILSYLSLEDRIKSRAVSRRWYNVINSFKAKSLCFSEYSSDFIYRKSHWVSGAFAQNFINSTKFQQFFQTFGQSILANLKHLRLCKLVLNLENKPASFVQILNSFDQLEELDIYDIQRSSELGRDLQVRLNLPMLKSFQLVFVPAIKKLTLDAPKLQNVKLVSWSEDLKMELVHGGSVGKLIIDRLNKMEVKKMKNLKYLYCGEDSSIDSTLLSTLEQLVEIHLYAKGNVSNLFQQKGRYNRSNLRIFLLGFHLNAPDDPAIKSLGDSNERYLVHLANHSSRLAEDIPLNDGFDYSAIEAVAPGLEIDILKRFTDLQSIYVHQPVQDVDRFLELLKNFDNIVELVFRSDQQPDLFDQLPGHCTIQSLEMINAPADLNFLFELKSLTHLVLFFSIDIEFISRVFEELPLLLYFEFEYLNEKFVIDHLKKFTVCLQGRGGEEATVCDVNAVVQWISEKATEEEESEYEVSEDEDEESEDEEWEDEE